MPESAFNIYNASAGSGKTFTLVKEYLKILLKAKDRSSFQQILAVTFTNKAVNEMKQRILDSLSELKGINQDQEPSDLANILIRELGIDRVQLQKQASLILDRILHNYAFFEISTIDKFTHRVIRTFAKDLRISQNFEVLLDTDLLLDEAVGNLLSKAGENPELTRALIDFSLEKTDEDKHWDISRDLNKVGKMLFKENELVHLKTLESKSIGNFKSLRQLLRKQINKVETELTSKGEAVLQRISKEGFDDTDFPNKTLPNHFRKIRDLQIDATKLYDNKLEENLRSAKIVKSGIAQPDSSFIEELLKNYLEIKSLVFHRDLLKNASQNILPLTVLNAILKEVKALEEERDLLPISSFNTLISNTINNQPAPFIYERLGEKFRHYFIDEFQDTSLMQWNNLIPLVANALESVDEGGSSGSLMIVGDVKQAIYRWRGGKPEQFLDLISSRNNPFTIQPEIHKLLINYRSRNEIIQFNNAFFNSASDYLNDSVYQILFAEETTQIPNKKEGGYIQLEFLQKSDMSTDDSYLDRILKVIEKATDYGYAYDDICILTRKRKHGVLISQGLAKQGIPVTSSETLLLKSNPEVRFLIHLLKVAIDPEDLDARFKLLSYLIPESNTFHREIKAGMEDPGQWLWKNWKFDLEVFKFQSVYDGLENALASFDLIEQSDAFVAYLLDEVLALEQKYQTSIAEFLNYWEINEDKLSISAPANLKAVKIMTIHKAKGLEFPVVIYPYTNTDIYEELDPKIWIKTNAEHYEGFTELLINKNKQLQNYQHDISEIYSEELKKQEMDAFNVLYVALTRAIDALFVICDNYISSKGIPRTNRYSGLFMNFLVQRRLWDSAKSLYSFGTLQKSDSVSVQIQEQESIRFTKTTKPETLEKLSIKGKAIWSSERADAIEKGTLIHYILSMIEKASEIDSVFENLIEDGIIKATDMEELKSVVIQIVSHPDLKSYFQKDSVVLNEQEIITENGLILRPDRLVFNKDEVVVLDYKTGAPHSKYQDQVRSYGIALEQMGYKLDKSILVYINKEINTEFIK